MRGGRRGGVIVSCFVMLGSAPVAAQPPVCPAPHPTDEYYVACRSELRFPVARLLADAAIDHLFKESFDRRLVDLLRVLDVFEVVPPTSPFVDGLMSLPGLQFTTIDSATGTFEVSVAADRRMFATRLIVEEESHRIAWRLPPKIAGGYWRTPSVFQMVFWRDHRIDVKVPSGEGFDLHARIDCLIVSADAIRIVTSGSADILVLWDGCE